MPKIALNRTRGLVLANVGVALAVLEAFAVNDWGLFQNSGTARLAFVIFCLLSAVGAVEFFAAGGLSGSGRGRK